MAEKLQRAIDDFSLGLNTRDPAHKLDPRELRVADWVEGADKSLTKAKAPAKLISTSLGTGGIQGMNSFVKKDGTEVTLIVWGGKLYKHVTGVGVNTWLAVPVRAYTPRGVSATLTSTSAGAHLLANTTYKYRLVANYGATSAEGGSEVSVTTANPAKTVQIQFYGCYGADSYDIYRQDAGTGAFALLVTGLHHEHKDVAGAGTESRVYFTDDGSYTPSGSIAISSASNSTDLSLGTGWVGFQQDIVNPDMVYFSGGTGLMVYNAYLGTASMVTPAVYDSTYGPNSLLLFTEPVHKCKFLTSHSNYNFVIDNTDEPSNVYYSRLGHWDYWPGLSVLHSDTNGKVKSAQRLYNVLGVATDRGVSTLHGKTFTPDSANFDGYWSTVSVNGISSGRSWVRVASNGRDILVGATADKDIRGVYADTSVESYLNSRSLADHIKPALSSLTDWSNAAAVFWKGRYLISFPADGKVFVGYPDRRADGFAWYGPYSGVKISCWSVRVDGLLLCGDSENGIVYVWDSAYTLPDGTAYTMKARTMDMEQVLQSKKLRRAYLKAKQQSSPSTVTARVYADYDVVEKTGIDLNNGGVVGAYELGEDSLGYTEAPFTLTGLRTKGRTMSYEVESSTNEPVTIYGFYELFSLKKAR